MTPAELECDRAAAALASLRDRVAALEADRQMLSQQLLLADRRGDSAEAEVARLKQDAARYRWLRSHWFDLSCPASVARAADVETVDAAIDAACAEWEGLK